MFLKQILAREEGKCASFENIKFPIGNYQTDGYETNTVLSTTKISSARQFKNCIELFSTFLDESGESQMKILMQFQLFLFCPLVYKKNFR